MAMRHLIFLLAALVTPVTAQAQSPSPLRQPVSSIISVEISATTTAGRFGGRAYRKISGTIHGVAAASEPVAGLRGVAGGRDLVPYSAGFELIMPDDPGYADGIVVEAANRGSAIAGRMLRGMASHHLAPFEKTGPAGDGAFPNDWLLAQHLSYANIQWQVGFAQVPADAQGVGEVIIRDFGRMLGGAFPDARAKLPIFPHRILMGISQSAWTVNGVIADGFNADPATGRGVYQGAFTRDGAGNVLTINHFAADGRQSPYLSAGASPLTPDQLLSRPASDPVIVDVTSATDFYRIRASVFARARGTSRLYRYGTAAAHAVGGLISPDLVFGQFKCNDGVPIQLNPTNDGLYLRPLLIGLANAVGARTATPVRLPAQRNLLLEPVGAGYKEVNRLPNVQLWAPVIGTDGAYRGGLPLIAATMPVGLPKPPALPPVAFSTIADVCGNFSGWAPFSSAELRSRYGSRAAYIRRARQRATRLVKAGYLLEGDLADAVEDASSALPDGF